jgi:hypothetical protein
MKTYLEFQLVVDMICKAELTFCGGISRYLSRSQVQLGNEGITRYRKTSGGIGLDELFEALQRVAHPALPVDFLEPFQTPG